MLNLLLWDSINMEFILVDQSLTVAQMLTILMDKGNTLEEPILKLLLNDKTADNSKNIKSKYIHSASQK